MGTELFHADGSTDSMSKLTVIICNCATIYLSRKHSELKKLVRESPYHYRKHRFSQMQDGQHDSLQPPYRVLYPLFYPKIGQQLPSKCYIHLPNTKNHIPALCHFYVKGYRARQAMRNI